MYSTRIRKSHKVRKTHNILNSVLIDTQILLAYTPPYQNQITLFSFLKIAVCLGTYP